MAPEYRYTAYTASGSRENGTLEAVSQADALQRLKRQGMVPARVESAEAGSDAKAWWQKDVALFSRGPGMREVARICDTLAALLRAGIALPAALSATADGIGNATTKTALLRFRDGLESGRPLQSAAGPLRDVLPAELIDLLVLGDRSNRLAVVLEEASKLFRKRAALADKLASALIYPAILVLAALGLMGVLVFFLAPALRPLFVSAGVEATGVLAMLFWANDALTANGVWIAASLPIAFGGIYLLVTQTPFGQGIAGLVRKAPVVGRVLLSGDLSVVARSLALLVDSGMPVQQAFRLTGSATPGDLGMALAHAAERAEHGEQIAPAFRDADVPAAFSQLLAAAEASNQWPLVLSDTADLFEAEAGRGQERLAELITPALTLLIGVVVGFVMISVVGAILDINELSF